MEPDKNPFRRLDGKTVSGIHRALKQHTIRELNKAHSSRGGGRGGRPPGLRGKEIGLYYRDQQKKRQAEVETRLESSVVLPSEAIAQIESMLTEYDNGGTSTYRSEFESYFNSIQSTSFEDNLEASAKQDQILEDDHYDEILAKAYSKMVTKPKYIENLSVREKLPVYVKREEILRAVEKNQIILISGDTGCGKTTQVPQFLLDECLAKGKGSQCKIFCTQPRRISAITVAERVAWERAEHLGESVGYQIRLQAVMPNERGSITYCTTGILLKRLESDPLLNGISHIFLDEVHERDVNTDIVMGLLKQVLSYRHDIKLILMSATFNTGTFSKYFNDCLTITVKGTLFPVQELYLEDVLEEIKFMNFPEKRTKKEPKWVKYRNKYKNECEPQDDYASFIEPYARSIRDDYSKFVIEAIQNPTSEEINLDLLCALIFYITLRKPPGAILVFLPGYEKISKLHTDLTKNRFYSRDKMLLYPLHSMMPTADQKSIFARPPDDVRKVILSTNIAETSITIDDVVYVINAGKMKITSYNVETNLQTLEETWTTLANMKQRKGRAGRVQSGICYHLFTRAREFTLDPFPTPEILRTRLDSVILNLKMLRIHNVEDFFSKLISTPHENVVKNSVALLKRLNALDDKEFITPLGLHLARLPLDPQVGKMILLAGMFNCLDPITSVAATLSFKDPFYRPIGKEKLVDDIRERFSEGTKSDHLTSAHVISEYRHEKHRGHERSFCYDNFLSSSILNQLENMKGQFSDILMDAKFIKTSNLLDPENNQNSSDLDLLRSIIAAGLYPNIAKLRKIKIIRNRADPVINMMTPEDGRVSIHPSSINCKQRSFDYKFFVYFMKQKSSAIYLFDTTMISPLALLIFGDGEGDGYDDHGNQFISLGDNFRFKTNKASASLILKLRQKFDELLQKKAINPSPIEPDSVDAILIKAIVTVLNVHRFHDGRSDCSSDEG